MRSTQQFFIWLFLAIFSTSFISCVDNSESDTIIPKAENTPGAVTYTENDNKRFISTIGNVYIAYYVSAKALIITAEKSIVKEDSNSSVQLLKFTVKNITTLSDLDSTTLTMVSTDAAGLPIPYVEMEQESKGPVNDYDTKSLTAKLDIRKAGNGSLEAYFEAYLESSTTPKAIAKITDGVIHRAPIYYQ